MNPAPTEQNAGKPPTDNIELDVRPIGRINACIAVDSDVHGEYTIGGIYRGGSEDAFPLTHAIHFANCISSHQRLIEENGKLRAALERLRDCDFVITPRDRMDAVRDIARQALSPQ